MDIISVKTPRMSVSQAGIMLWATGIIFMILPHLNQGLLSDYKICGDSECASSMSRVQAIRDNHAKDCRFLSFRQGETIFVYHKLTGKRQDLWAGSINKQFGYFPKDAVKEEEVYTTLEKVVKTQRSDFFCMDEFGYPVDSSYLDTEHEDDNNDDEDHKIQNQNSKTTQTSLHTDDNAESQSTFEDSFTESLISTQEVEGKNNNDDDHASRIHDEEQSEVSDGKQGGSHSSSWLGSSVTGWLGLAEEGEPGNMIEHDKKDESDQKETQAKAALTSSVTGWLGFGGEGKPDDSTENVKKEVKTKAEESETADSFTSGMTKWLGFGGDRNLDPSKEEMKNDEESEKEEENETGEKFRSRRIALDLDSNQLYEEERKEMGTLDWLGNEMSSMLKFSLTNQEPVSDKTDGERKAEETIQEEDPPTSSSWLDLGIRDILGFKKNKGGVDETIESGFKEEEEDKTLQQLTSVQNTDTIQSQKTEGNKVRLEEKVTTKTETVIEGEDDSISSSSKKDIVESEVTAIQQDEETESGTTAQVSTDGHNDNGDTSDGSKDYILPTDNASKDNTPQTKLEERSLSVDGMYSMLNSFFGKGGKEEEGNDVDNKDREMHQSSGDEGNRDTGGKNDIISKPVLNYADFTSNSMRRSMGEDEEDYKDQLQSCKPDMVDEEGREITNQTDNTEESTEMSGASGDDEKAEGRNEETEILHRDIQRIGTTDDDTFSTAQTDESVQHPQVSGDEDENSNAKTKPSGPPEDKHDQVLTEDTSYTPHGVKTNSDHPDTVFDDRKTEETSVKREVSNQHPAESPYESSSEEFDTHRSAKSTEIQYERASQEVTSVFVSSENTTDQDVSNTGQAFSTQRTHSDDEDGDDVADNHQETEKETKNESENIFQPAQTEEKMLGFEESILNKSGPNSAGSSEAETETSHVKSSHFELGSENLSQSSVYTQNDTVRQEPESKDKEIEAENGLDLGFSGAVSNEEKGETESLQMEEERVEEEENREEMEELKEDERQKKVNELQEEEKQEVVEEVWKEEKKEGEQKQKDEEDDGRDKEEKKSLALIQSSLNEEVSATEDLNELYPQDLEAGSANDKGRKYPENELNSTEKITKETEKQNPMDDSGQISANMTGKSNKMCYENTEVKERDVEEEGEKKEEEKTLNEDAKSDEDKEKQNEIKYSESNRTANEDSGVEADQTGQIKHRDNDQASSGETSHGSSNDIVVCQKDQQKQHDQLYSGETKIVDFCHSNDKTKIKDNDVKSSGETSIHGSDEITQQIDSDHKVDTEEDVNEGGKRRNTKDDDVSIKEEANILMMKEGAEISPSVSGSTEGQVVISEQTIPNDSNDLAGSSAASQHQHRNAANGEAFGFFKNAFSFFSPTPITEMKESTESVPRWDASTGETTQQQSSLILKQELDLDTDSTVVNIQVLHPNPPASELPQELQPSLPFAETQESSLPPAESLSHVHSLSPDTETQFKKKTAATLSKHYKTFLSHMSMDEATIVIEIFGEHKLEWLDYILGSSETVTENPDHDESILIDIERLLDYHRKLLMAPSLRFADAPQEDKERTRTLIALQKLDMLLMRVREIFSSGKSAISNTILQAEAGCVDEPCSTQSKDREKTTEEEPSETGESGQRDEGMGKEKGNDGQQAGDMGKERKPEMEKKTEMEEGNEEERAPSDLPDNEMSNPHTQPGSPQPQEGVMKQTVDFVHWITEDATPHVHAVREILMCLLMQVVSALPDDIRPGPDLYGLPWEPVIVCSLVGLVTILLFSCRCYSSVKSRMYRSKEKVMAEQVAQLLEEKCEVLQTLSKYQQEYDDLESSLRNSGVLAQTEKVEHLEVKARQLENGKRGLERDLEHLKDQLEQQREHRAEQERKIAALEESVKTFEEETKDFQSQEEQAQTTLKVYNMNSDRLQRNLETAEEENTVLQESNAQLRQQVEGWAERVSELEEEMRRCECASSGMLQDVANKDERIMSLTDLILLRMRAWDSDLEEEQGRETTNGKAGGRAESKGNAPETQLHLQKVQKLVYAAKLNADLKSVDEDKDRVFAKLNDEVKAKEDLQEGIKDLEKEKLLLQSETERYSDEVQRLQQKLQIMTEMYQENELKLHRLLTVEEKERLQKEEKLNKADRNIALAMEELHNYRQRAEEMEEELEKTKQSYQTQISAHEKKAHNNWLAARAAERELADIRRESALIRQKLTDTQFKLDALDKDPYSLDGLARSLPFRGERSPYGPSPLGRPASETRAFLSPPTLMDGPPSRLSPRARGPLEPPGGQGEMERSGGPHSDSGSISPTWERDRRPPPRGILGPAGYMFPEPGGPMYRRPAPPPGALGPLPPPGSLPLGPLPPRGFPSAGPPGPPHPADMADGAFRENSLGPAEQEHREPGPGDRRTPPEADRRMEDGPPLGPIDGPFPRRAPYGPPPPDFYPFRGPSGPPVMPMWAPLPPPHPGMMYPPRYPPGGPLLLPAPHPHMPSYGPSMRLPPPDGLPPPSMGPLPPRHHLPSPPHSQSSEEHTPSPQDVI
ncbi:hypothetical protein LDENG_00166610 [Lucifuga dentata]|nr:hypothetical protein LDENG_00166610 [Lucifuga dentata]